MPGRAGAGYNSPIERWEIRPLSGAELERCAPLMQDRLELDPANQIPPWFMQTTGCYGGLTLGAFDGAELVGYSYALAGCEDGRHFLLSCGLAVARSHASLGIGEALKREQARHALRAGYRLIRWTTNPLASAPLHLYLSKLGARLVRYRRDMYAEVRESVFPDEVEIDWDLTSADTAVAEGPPPHTVEIPWDRAALLRRSEKRAREWEARVRTEMEALLAEGLVGTAVIADRHRERSRVRFDRRPG
jgi:predicted GNAT superfamily acetyltransferase